MSSINSRKVASIMAVESRPFHVLKIVMKYDISENEPVSVAVVRVVSSLKG